MTLPVSKKGLYFALLTAFISGVSIFINKFAVGAITPPLLFTAVKNTGVALLIFCVILAAKKFSKIKNLTKREIGYLLLIGIVGGAVPFYLFFTGLSMIPAINAALIHKTLVLWVAILAVPLLREKLSKLQGMAILILFTANLLTGGFKGLEFSAGEMMVLAATVLWAIENVLAKRILNTVDPDIVVGARMGIGSLLLLGAVLVTQPQAVQQGFLLNGVQVFWLTATTVSLLAYVMTWYRALKFAPAVTVSTVLVGSTLVTNILSVIFVTKIWDIDFIIQGIFITLGLLLYVFSIDRSVLKSRA